MPRAAQNSIVWVRLRTSLARMALDLLARGIIKREPIVGKEEGACYMQGSELSSWFPRAVRNT